MTRSHRHWLVSIVLVFASTSSLAATFVEDFNDGVLDPRLTAGLDPGFTMTIVSGELEMAKSSGTMNGSARVETKFEVIGDFVATVDAHRLDLTSFADLALQSLHPSGSGQFVDVFFNDQTKIIANFFVAPSHASTIINTSVSPVTFKIERVGQTITAGYIFNGGFVAVAFRLRAASRGTSGDSDLSSAEQRIHRLASRSLRQLHDYGGCIPRSFRSANAVVVGFRRGLQSRHPGCVVDASTASWVFHRGLERSFYRAKRSCGRPHLGARRRGSDPHT